MLALDLTPNLVENENMTTTPVEVMRAEAKRFRSLADRLDALAAEIASQTQPVVASGQDNTCNRGGLSPTPRPQKVVAIGGEYAGLTQNKAILKALQLYGPQTTAELYERLNAGGMTFKKAVYVTAIVARLRDAVERIDGGKIKLKTPIAA